VVVEKRGWWSNQLNTVGGEKRRWRHWGFEGFNWGGGNYTSRNREIIGENSRKKEKAQNGDTV